MSDTERRAWILADGRRTVAEIGRSCGAEASGERLLGSLARRRAVVLAPRVDPRTDAPLDRVQELVERLPASRERDRWRLELDGVREQVGRFACGTEPQRAAALHALEQRYEALTADEARRGAGEVYADRSLLFEERESQLGLRLGGTFGNGLAAELTPALSLWASAAGERARMARRDAARMFEERWPAAEAVSLPRFLAAVAATAGERDGTPREAATTVEGKLARLVARACGDARLEVDDLMAFAALPPEPAFTSIDLLIAAPDTAAIEAGAHRLVLGEAHAAHLLAVFPTDHFRRRRAPERSRQRDLWLCGLLAHGGRRLAQVVPHRGSKIFPYPLPVHDIELRPHLETDGAIPAAALVVRRDGDHVELCDEDGPLNLLPALSRARGLDALEAFTLPAVESIRIGTGCDIPRVTYGRVVIQRRSWRRRLPEAVRTATGARRALEAWRWKDNLGAPDVVFARLPGEPKPVLVDFASPVSVEALLMLTAPGNGEVTLTEMLPGPDELWLRGDDGRHTCELRLLAALEGAR